ncbi:hypothetical protein IPZ58_29225 [Streptomyces roseoverticillatus]|uniref:hypothetical protein n=1 Tax=Streptomyces roseoverticillatus TaxID=66429 RepID=UPI001F2D43AC|nr:hypothetical protein [Streptomyces roseoverticillatus]MCF3105646.1 hypothetical protein [Streptomyces roseoverticillatus]
MALRQISQVRRAATAVSLAAALALTLSACGSDDKKEEKPAAAGQPAKQDSGPGRASDTKAIATLKGAQGISLDITSAARSAGGFVTVSGTLRNTADEDFAETSPWSGPEIAVKQAAGNSLGGATLVDGAEKKRYYTLRDTENRPLVSTGLGIIKAKSEQKVFMQFPAPPKSTSAVDIQIPTFQAATLKLTDA